MQHAKDSMVSVCSKLCANGSCGMEPSFGVDGSKVAVYCRQHSGDGLVNVRRKHCAYGGCSKAPSFGQ